MQFILLCIVPVVATAFLFGRGPGPRLRRPQLHRCSLPTVEARSSSTNTTLQEEAWFFSIDNEDFLWFNNEEGYDGEVPWTPVDSTNTSAAP